MAENIVIKEISDNFLCSCYTIN